LLIHGRQSGYFDGKSGLLGADTKKKAARRRLFKDKAELGSLLRSY
jgi:hypothetical protein